VSSPRATRGLVSAIAAAAVTLWVGYAVVAAATRTAPRPVAPAPTRHAVTPPRLGLSEVPALRVRAALLERAAATAPVVHVRPRRAARTKTRASASPARQPAMGAPTPARATPAPTSAVQPPPAARPAPQPQPPPRRTAQPKRPSPPDFDESAPSGFDNQG
jgi:hypothetical protein